MAETLKSRLQDDMKSSMKSGNKERLGVIRLMLSAIKQIEVDERIELDNDRITTVLDKMAKQRRESITQFDSAGRDDLTAIEQAELRRSDRDRTGRTENYPRIPAGSAFRRRDQRPRRTIHQRHRRRYHQGYGQTHGDAQTPVARARRYGQSQSANQSAAFHLV